ncbi:MAG: MutS-related protein [Solirubrobacteraceae bacterium]
MAGDDAFLFDVARLAVLTSLRDPDEIAYRQHVFEDCLTQQPVVRAIYDLTVEAIQSEKKIWRVFTAYPGGTLHRAVEVLERFVAVLRRLRTVADHHSAGFHSEGFTTFFAMLSTDLTDDYFDEIEAHLKALRFHNGVLVGAELGRGNRGSRYVLRDPRQVKRSWRERLGVASRSAYVLRISDRDENGARAIGELRDRGVNLAADALARSADHILAFFTMLRRELGFYIGCLNLHARLEDKGEPVCLPLPVRRGEDALCAHSLYDVGLALRLDERVVGNDVAADGASLVMITGANQGGKSTLLRGLGLAQLMMQAGMFVGATSFSADVRERLFTHYRREEDATMTSGKLDEELSRMSEIADRAGPGSIVLFNESFAATNEREGSEIARQVIRALREAGVKVLFVTHLFDLAHSLYTRGPHGAVFLRAERTDDGRRTFRLVEGEPLSTSFGRDLYEQVLAARHPGVDRLLPASPIAAPSNAPASTSNG